MGVRQAGSRPHKRDEEDITEMWRREREREIERKGVERERRGRKMGGDGRDVRKEGNDAGSSGSSGKRMFDF